MKIEYIGVVEDSNWGKFVYYKDKKAYLEFGGHHSQFKVGEKYRGNIVHFIWIGNIRYSADSIEDLLLNPQVRAHGLTDFQVGFQTRKELRVDEN
jgi:hypothetical protein